MGQRGARAALEPAADWRNGGNIGGSDDRVHDADDRVGDSDDDDDDDGSCLADDRLGDGTPKAKRRSWLEQRTRARQALHEKESTESRAMAAGSLADFFRNQVHDQLQDFLEILAQLM